MRSSIKIFAAGCLVLTALGFQSCKKTVNSRTSTSNNFSNSSIIQVYIPMVNTTGNNVYIDAKQVTGGTSTVPLATGSLFPSTGFGAAVDGGMRAFALISSTAAQPHLSFAENLQAGKNYTVFVYDTFTTPKQKTVETTIVIPDDTTARLRFANFIYSASAVPNVDVYSYSRATTIFTNVTVTDVTGFIPYPSGVSPDSLFIRETGTTNNLIKLSIGALTQKRSYTLVYRGSHKVTKVASLFANR